MQFGHFIRNFQLFSINHAHILLSSLKLNTNGLRLPSGTDCPPSRGNHPGYIFQYITHVHFYKIEKYVDANLDASDNVISGNEPSVYSNVTFHINGYHNDRSAPCLYTVTGWVSCPVSAAWHSCVAAHWSKYHCYKQAPLRYDLRCLKATLNPNNQTSEHHKGI